MSTVSPLPVAGPGREPEAIGRSSVSDDLLRLTNFLAKMEPARPGILRATRACNVLRLGGLRLLRPRQRPDLFELSVPVAKIDELWSHSWHGGKYLKALLLLLLYNGRAAMIIASLSALLMMCLHTAELLPGYETWLSEDTP